MLTDNIYDIIPGYAELEENLMTVMQQSETSQGELSSLKNAFEEMTD